MNGYIEEMMAGQKVVKVFCHEEEGKEKSPNCFSNLDGITELVVEIV